MKDDLLALVKSSAMPSPHTAFDGVRESDLTLAEAGEALSADAAAVVRKRPHMRYLQRLQRLEWLARMLDDEECPAMFKLKAMEMLQKSMGDYKQEVTVHQASAVLVVHENFRGGGDDVG